MDEYIHYIIYNYDDNSSSNNEVTSGNWVSEPAGMKNTIYMVNIDNCSTTQNTYCHLTGDDEELKYKNITNYNNYSGKITWAIVDIFCKQTNDRDDKIVDKQCSQANQTRLEK